MMSKMNKRWIIVITLIIILAVVFILIFFKQLRNQKSILDYNLTNTTWNLISEEQISKNKKNSLNEYLNVNLYFTENIVNICVFYENGNTCSINKYSKDSKRIVVEKDKLTNVYGSLSLDKKENLVLEQEIDNNSKKVYYFSKEEGKE